MENDPSGLLALFFYLYLRNYSSVKPVSLLFVHLLTISLAFAQNLQPATPFVSYKEGSENILFLINHYPLVARRYGDFRWMQVMNILGYEVLKRKEIPKSIVVFELTVRENRDKSNTYNSLDESIVHQ